MFSIGDKVVYPMQGIGIIERIEDKLFSGKNREYIIVKILSNNLEIMIPSDKVSNSNLRKICDNSTLDDILFNISDKNNELESITAKERYQSNMTKVKSGELKDSAEVVYELILANKEKFDEIPNNVFRESSRINSTFGGNFIDVMRLKLICLTK